MRKLLFLMVLTGLLALSSLGPGPTAYAADDVCLATQLKAATVSVSVSLKHDGEATTRAESRLVVRVPKTWGLAPDLLLSGDSERYRKAMRCLLRDPATSQTQRDTEWRPGPPAVAVTEKWITVDYFAVTHVDDRRDRDFGVWRISPGERFWRLILLRPPSLDQAWWQKVTVDLGGRAARSMTPMPTTGSTTRLTWDRPKPGGPAVDVRVGIQPPATKALAAQWGEGFRYLAGPTVWLLWSGLVLVGLLRLVRRLSPAPTALPQTAAEEATRRNLLLWAWITAVAALVFEVDDQLPRFLGDIGVFAWWPDHRVAVHFVLTVCGGAALCLFGRPRPEAWVTVLIATAYTLLVAVAPERFGLPTGFWLFEDNTADVERLRQAHGMVWIALACWCVAFVWLVGTLASLRRVSEAVRAPAAGVPPRGRFPWWALIVCAAVALLVVGLGLGASQGVWAQENWLSAHDPAYRDRRLAYLYNGLAWFPSNWADWFHPSICGWYGVIGVLLTVLAARSAAPGAATVSPGRTELFALSLLLVAQIIPTPGGYAGAPVWMVNLLPLFLAALLLLAVGRRRAVLSRTLGENEPSLREVIRETDRSWLIKSARQYRDLHSQLRRLEQGDQDSERAQLEDRLDAIHRWNPGDTTSGHAGKKLPHSVDAVDLTLAWGPCDTWWDNARRAALFAVLLSLPATAVAFWANNVRGSLWGDTARSQFGVVSLIDYVVTWEVVGGVLGFTLGALWRVLPGRRGPAKAMGLSLVYAAPIAVHWLLSTIAGESIGTSALDVALTLFVLTSTGVVMDIDTFRREDHYWPTKAALLLSVYQLRTASVQLAFFVAQAVALVGVWQQLKGNDPMVLIQPEPPPGTPESGGVP
ncbi:DUF6185 family protein [Streptomyces sp. NBC_00103]|uniref:DUF6185 family protein n=1 Tax=Streptomyces sp. NBC_00103 TaxID=2975653 RepID=UPI002250C242|nr:DUF6185 family protein [Streptomyces sp. NBC_00103]MCX5374770.1 DUF6185 family protein [Streptomyces sp. NBC_00103]